MSIRDRAIGYLARRLVFDENLQKRLGFGPASIGTRSAARNVITSKVHQPQRSWTGRWSWWHQLTPDKIEGDGVLVLVCEERDDDGFHVLAVPKSWLRENVASLSFSEAQGKFNVFLSAERGDRFLDRRGSGLDFTRWLVDGLMGE